MSTTPATTEPTHAEWRERALAAEGRVRHLDHALSEALDAADAADRGAARLLDQLTRLQERVVDETRSLPDVRRRILA